MSADLSFEQARNAEYLELLKAKGSTRGHLAMGVTRSRLWVEPGAAPSGGAKVVVPEPFIGRVGLASEEEFLGNNFYVGPRHVEHGDLRVFSWAAPVAQLFFGGDGEPYEHVNAMAVAVRRAFDSELDVITGLVDEWVRHVTPSPLDGLELQVPAPTGVVRGRVAARREAVTGGEVVAPPAEDADPVIPPALMGMRSPQLVLKRLSAPRKERIASVLSTLQPDQYRLVSSAVNAALIVQGHPGTGKTIVAAYRAAYLVDPEQCGRRVPSVLLLGPTAEYVRHVEGLLLPLDPDGCIATMDVSQVLERVVGLEPTWSGGFAGQQDPVDASARGLADLAVRRLRANARLKTGKDARRANLRAVYDLIAGNGEATWRLSSDEDHVVWMSKLPSFEVALKERRYLPLMAQCALAIQKPPLTDRFDHIIVDEAQDVSPIEWNVLDQLLRPEGTWTLVGDMNQRRSATTYGSWAQISDHLGLGSGDAAAVPAVMQRGYRSTKQILQFADKLLPAAERGAISIQGDGPPVALEKVNHTSALMPRALGHAAELLRRYPRGTVALITVDADAATKELGTCGWRRGRDRSTWTHEGHFLRVLVPEAARGLEFDGVVVVEPGAFPENLGRAGQLYTSLTRANRELAVVAHEPLPDGLRKASRA